MRTTEDLRANACHLSGTSLRSYLSTGTGRHGELSLHGSALEPLLVSGIDGAYDIAIISVASGMDEAGERPWPCCAPSRMSHIPALLSVAADTPRSLRIVESGVNKLLNTKGAIIPAAFCLDPYDMEIAAGLADQWGIPSWGDGLDAAALAGRILDRAVELPDDAGAPSGREIPNDPAVARPGGVDDLIAEVKADSDFQKIMKGAGACGDTAELRRRVASIALRLAEGLRSSRNQSARTEELVSCSVEELLGLGPLEYLMRDEGVTEIMVNGPSLIFFEKDGRLHKAPISFSGTDHLVSVIERMLAPTGRRLDEASPMVDARLADGSRLHAAIPPVAIDGALLTVRRFSRAAWGLDELVDMGAIPADAARFLSDCVRSRVSMVVSGGTGTGKTTLLAALASCTGDDERTITIEDAAELRINRPHVVRLEARPPNIEGVGAISIRDLVRNALRMRPDRIVVGECRGPEAVDMLQAMNTGHEGSLTTVHANSPRDAMSRLETMVLMAALDLPVTAIREQIARAIGIIVQLARAGSARKVVEISEITGMEGHVITMQTLASVDPRSGELTPTGLAPALSARIGGAGIRRFA